MPKYNIEWSGTITRDIGWVDVDASSHAEAIEKFLQEHGRYRRVRSIIEIEDADTQRSATVSEQKIWTNSGRAFNNDDKKSERHADQRGDGEVTCPHCNRRILFFIDLWNKMGAKGPWASFSFKVKDKQPDAGATPPQDQPQAPARREPPRESLDFGQTGGPPARSRPVSDDDIPF